MLKHDKIIKNMSRAQKVALLTDESAPCGVEASRLGIPAVKSAELSKLAEKYRFPSYESLAASWNTNLIYQVTHALAAEARKTERANLLITPDLKSAVNPYVVGLSEDAYLNGAIGSAISGGVHADGSACALSKFSCTADDVAYLDCDENPQVVYDLFCKPFHSVMNSSPCEAVITSMYRTISGYSDTNVRLFDEVVSSDFCGDVYVICERVSEDVRYQGYIGGGVCFKGEEVTIDRALGRYDALARSAANGSISQNDLQGALSSGIAVNGDTADLAADKIIDFAFKINQLKPSADKPSELSAVCYRAAVESIVLLKNSGVLPLAADARVAAIGNSRVQFETYSGLNVVSFADGFADEKDDVVVRQNALRAAESADVLIVFLDLFRDGGKVEKLALPVNLLKLIQQLKELGKLMIAVLPSDMPVDSSFDADFSAVITAPYESGYCSAALGAVLAGREIPCGRLARSYYDGADARFKMIKEDRNAGRIKIGEFCGYRQYETDGEKVRYPFGYGLSYTCFAYSGLHVSKDRVSFTIKNVGKCGGDEVAQIYVGSPNYPYIKKELKAFVKVHLAAGEKRTVSVDLPPDCFEYLDVKSRTRKTYSGVYKIYVGASVSDIRLKGAVNISGERAENIEKEQTAYAQPAGADYSLGSENGKAVRKKRRIVRNISVAVLILSLIAFIIAGVLAYVNSSVNISLYIYIIGAVFAAAFIVLMIDTLVRRGRVKVEETDDEEPEPIEFTSPVLKTSTPISVFENAFTASAADGSGGKSKETDEPNFFDRGFTFKVIRTELETYLAERGCKMTTYNVSRLIASLAASRAVVFTGGAEKQLNALAPALSEYFGTPLYECNNDFYNDKTSSGAISRAAKDAENNPEKIFILLYRQINEASLFGLVFAKNAEHASRLARFGRETDIVIPPNLWVIATLADGETLGSIPANTAESVALFNLEMTEVESTARKTAVKPLGFYQLDNLCGEIRGEFEIDEGLWKRIDRFEETLGSDVFHSVGNRTWVKIEKFAAAFLACGGGAEEAIDGAVATQLLVSLCPVIAEKEITVKQLLLSLEEVFGSENIGCCRKIISTFFTDADVSKKGDEAL